MQDLIASGQIAAFILLLTLAELLGFTLARKIWNTGPPLATLLPSITAGAFLLLAWWLSAAHWLLAAAALAGALAAHGLDIANRLRN